MGEIKMIIRSAIPTFQQFPSFGRIYAAYGGVFIIMSILWGWWIDNIIPDFYDWVGTVIALLGTGIILWAPRQELQEGVNKE
jgi:small multidrug resistance family-3 protein